MANTLRFKRGLASGIPTALAGEPLFTTDTFDLYIGNGTTNTRFQKYIASGTTSQLLRGDGSLLTMPIVLTSPSTGQVLKYNGTSWVNDSDAGITGSGTTNYLPKFTGASTLGNSIIFDNGTSVGISSASPSAGIKLQVDGSVFVNRSGNVNYVLNSASSHYGFIQNDAGNKWSLSSGTSLTTGLGTAALTWFSTGNVSIGNLSDNGLRFQVTGDASVNGNTASYIAQLNQANTTAGASFGTIIRGGTNVSDTALRIQNAAQTLNLLTVQGNGSLGLGTTLLTAYNFRISKTITGSSVAYGIDIDSAIQSDVTNSAVIYGTSVGTQATAFTLSNLFHYNATQGTFGAGSAVTSQFGFRVSSNMVGATNNYAYYGEIPSGTGRWNLYMNGTAANYLNGSLSIGTTSTSQKVNIVGGVINTGGFVLNRSDSFGFFTGASDDLGIYHDGTNSFISNSTGALIFNNPSERMRLDASGNLGLGVTPSAWGGPFKVMQLGTYGQYIAGQTNNADMKIGMNSYYNGTNYIYTNSGSVTLRYDFSANGYAWQIAPSGTAGNAITFTQAMTLDASGNLMIGPTSTTYKLDAQTTGQTIANLSSSNAAGGYVAVGRTASVSIFGSYASASGGGSLINSDALFFRNNSSGIAFSGSGATPRLWLTPTDNVIIGSTSDTGERLQVTGTAKITGQVTINNNLNVIASNPNVIARDNGTGYAVFVAQSQNGTGAILDSGVQGSIAGSLMTGAPVNSAIIGTRGSHELHFGTNGNSRMYLTTGGNFAVDTNTLFVDATNNRVGVLTATPSYGLHVQGTGYFNDNVRFPNLKGVVFVQSGGSLLGSISMDSSDQVTIDNNGFFGLSVGTSYNLLGGNTGIGTSSFGTSATRTFAMLNGTAPSTSPTDIFQMYSNDITAGNAAPHFRTENGAVVKIYQQTSAVGTASWVGGAGSTVTDLDTFDGYTIGQIVKALRNAGFLQ